ncbi:kelch repeat-containing protein [Acanthamoeba castellanii str. Neff]|uniref:Kelch repeat-containing protein n=1 Tax=Acanthamoeba castellanii (strain ATCC 30010 / Neff) TaxID=1257118 RepID=L8HJV9_ACACF|nr:kelch repeat-containing protein [Acanthamoeba castellanii str. Neff]ELR24661.1 kelch repeat-containing protein [Acanthamoeba castellanii str. Neff]
MWTSTKLMGDWPVKELCPYVALSSDASTAYIHQERAIFALSVDDSQWRRLPLPKSISDAPYQSIEGLFMYDQLLHVLIEKREGKTALQIYDPATGKWDGPITIKKKMWCTSLTRCGSKVYSVDSWDGAVNVLDLAAKNAYKWQTLTKEENELLKNLGSFSLTAYRQRLYLFGGKKGATEGSNDLYCFDLKKQLWSKVPVKGDVPPPRWGHSAALVGGSFYIFGGINSMANLNDIYQFDIRRRRWRAVDALCPPPNGKCSSAAWISDDTLYRVAIKTHPHNDVLYALDLETDDGSDDEELIEALQKTVKQMQKGLKKEAKKMKDDMQKMRDDINKKHAKDIKKLKKQIAAHDRGRVLAEEEIVEKIHKQLEEEAIRKEHQREDAQSMIITSTVDDEDEHLRSGGSCVGTRMGGEREEILKEVDELLSEELEEVRRELREEFDETRGQLMEAIESLQTNVGDSQKKQEKSESEAKEKEKSEEEMTEMKVLLEALKDEVARLKGEVAQLRTEKAANAVRTPQREASVATQPPEPVAASLRSDIDLVRVMSLLGISPTQTVLDQREIDWKNAKLIGNGAFGHTKVFQTRWRGIECAVKRVKKDSLSLADLRAIQTEIDTVSKAAGLHPHVAYVYGTCDPPEGGIGIVMELAHYGSVRDLLVRHTRLPMALLLSFAIDAAEGLQFLHAHHIPHKNIAAASVMVSHGMRGMLSDFGLTRVNAHTRWMAPEVMPVNVVSPLPEADVWAFGVFLWEICTGQLLRPWQGSNDAQVLTAVRNQGKCLVVPDESHATLKNIIQCCWRRDPSQRPSPEELVDSLRRLRQKTDGEGSLTTRIEPLIQPLAATASERPGAGFGSSPFASLGSQGSSTTSPASASSSDAYTANQSAWITSRLKQEWRKSSPVPHSPRAHVLDVSGGGGGGGGADSSSTLSGSPSLRGSTTTTTTTHGEAINAINRSVAAADTSSSVDKKSQLGRSRVDASAGKTRKPQQTSDEPAASTSVATTAAAAANNRTTLAGGSSRGSSPSLSSSSGSPVYVPSFPSLSSSSRNRSRSSSLSSHSSASPPAPPPAVVDDAPATAAPTWHQPSPLTLSLRSSDAGLDSSSSSHTSSDSSPPPARRNNAAYSPLPSFSTFSSLHSSTDGEDGGGSGVGGSRGPRSALSLSVTSLNSSASSLQDEPPSPPHSPAASRRPLFSPLPTRLFE